MTDTPQSYLVTDVTALSGTRPKPLTLQQAAGIAGVSPDTIARWCKRYGIGKQLHAKAPWRVDHSGLTIVMAGDKVALLSYQSGERASPVLASFATEAAR